MKLELIFFSYSRQDADAFALRLANDLRAAGAKVWIDQLDIPFGKKWDREIEKALNAATHVLFIASERSVTSENVLNEVQYAIDEGKQIIPIKIDNCRIPFTLRRYQYLRFGEKYDITFQRLSKHLNLPSDAALNSTEEKSIESSKETELLKLQDQQADPVSHDSSKVAQPEAHHTSSIAAPPPELVVRNRGSFSEEVSTPISSAAATKTSVKFPRSQTILYSILGAGVIGFIAFAVAQFESEPTTNDRSIGVDSFAVGTDPLATKRHDSAVQDSLVTGVTFEPADRANSGPSKTPTEEKPHEQTSGSGNAKKREGNLHLEEESGLLPTVIYTSFDSTKNPVLRSEGLYCEAKMLIDFPEKSVGRKFLLTFSLLPNNSKIHHQIDGKDWYGQIQRTRSSHVNGYEFVAGDNQFHVIFNTSNELPSGFTMSRQFRVLRGP
jgi:hypothetical protein